MSGTAPSSDDLPVIVGIAEVANKDAERIVHPVTLLEEAARLALEDAGAASLVDAIGAVYSAPLSVFSTEDGAALVAERLGLPAGPRHRERYSGAGAQRQLGHASAEILAGRADAALLLGGVADASVRRARKLGIEPPAPPTSVWSQGSDGAGDVTWSQAYRRPFTAEEGAGAGMPSSYFALMESSLGADAGHTPEQHRAWLGTLLEPFTTVAAGRPDIAWFPEPRTAEEISTPTDANRFVAEPYTKLMCSFPTVDLAAALVVVSTRLADRLGIPQEQRVHPAAVALGREAGAPSTRRAMHAFDALTSAVTRTGVDPAAVDAFDLYSCFPAAVQLGMAAFGLTPDDPRPRTLTGGLPYFGGPGAAYTLHGIAAAARRTRTTGDTTAVVGIGGMCDDSAVGVYSAAPPAEPPVFETEPTVNAAVIEVVKVATGAAIVEAATVLHDRDAGPVEAPVIARLPDGRRVGARTVAPGEGAPLVGAAVQLAAEGDAVTWRRT